MALLIGATAAVALTGCVATTPDPAPAPTTPAATDPTPTATPTASPEPALVPDGTADDNLPYFAAITEEVWASEQRAQGRAYIDALVAGGFDKAAMQVTQDQSTVGNPAESIQFSVRWGEQCLVGQVGPDIGEAVTRVLPALQGDTVCLLGATRPIDW